MTIEQLREVNRARPFRPFTIQLADGDRVRVSHPESLLITPSGRTIVVASSADAVKIIDLLLVAAIEVGNGRPRGRRR
jgi:hypothetical protein